MQRVAAEPACGLFRQIQPAEEHIEAEAEKEAIRGMLDVVLVAQEMRLGDDVLPATVINGFGKMPVIGRLRTLDEFEAGMRGFAISCATAASLLNVAQVVTQKGGCDAPASNARESRPPERKSA